MIRNIHIQGYRSLRDLYLNFNRVNVITGGNGVGKSNVYRALALMQRMAEGTFAQALAQEGGMPSVLWGGNWAKGPRRISWNITHEHFSYEMICGLIAADPLDPTVFRTDPEIKSESILLANQKVASRQGPMIKIRALEAKMKSLEQPLYGPESMLSELRDSTRYPALAVARQAFMDWRFYHQFRSDEEAPMRRTQVGYWSPVLANDGSNLAATLQTIIESGNCDINAIVAEAFPETEWSPIKDNGRFQLTLTKSGMRRSLEAAELSDGTLRYFCLVAALLSPKPPSLLVLNEPESSLHQGLIESLARLISYAPQSTQIIVVTHSSLLADAIEQSCEVKKIELVMEDSCTRIKEHLGSKKVWDFE